MTKEAEAFCTINSDQRAFPPDPTELVVHTAKKDRNLVGDGDAIRAATASAAITDSDDARGVLSAVRHPS